MEKLFRVFLVICIVVPMVVMQDDVIPRRDEKWPPKEFLIELKPIVEKCRATVNVKPEDIEEFSDRKAIENPDLKCYMNCLFHEYNVVDDTGHVHFETLYNKLPQSVMEVALNMLKQCEEPVGENLCEKAYWLHRCWKNADPKHYFLI